MGLVIKSQINTHVELLNKLYGLLNSLSRKQPPDRADINSELILFQLNQLNQPSQNHLASAEPEG